VSGFRITVRRVRRVRVPCKPHGKPRSQWSHQENFRQCRRVTRYERRSYFLHVKYFL